MEVTFFRSKNKQFACVLQRQKTLFHAYKYNEKKNRLLFTHCRFNYHTGCEKLSLSCPFEKWYIFRTYQQLLFDIRVHRKKQFFALVLRNFTSNADPRSAILNFGTRQCHFTKVFVQDGELVWQSVSPSKIRSVLPVVRYDGREEKSARLCGYDSIISAGSCSTNRQLPLQVH